MNRLKLVPFSEKNMPTVLGWRNSHRIRSNMLDNSVIAEEHHLEFLKMLEDDPSKAYFVVQLNDSPIAAIYFTGLGTSTVTWGCYIGSEKPVPGLFVGLVVLAAKFVFEDYQAEILRSEVAAHNSNPIKLNKFLGIPVQRRITKVTKEGTSLEFIEYKLEKYHFGTMYETALRVIPSSVKEALENFIMEK